MKISSCCGQTLSQMSFESLQDAFQYTKQRTKSGIKTFVERVTSEHTQKMAVSSMVFGSAISVLFITSIFIYLIIYFTSMPIVDRAEIVYLDYSGNVPTAILDVSVRNQVPVLMKPNQRYSMGLELVVPDSDTNLALGNFMVSMEMVGKNGLLRRTTRPAHLKYKSPLLRHLTTIYNSFSLLTDRSAESQTLFIPLVQNYEEKATQPVQEIRIEIRQPLLETYQTKIKFETEFQGLAYFMYHWSFSTALFFITNIMLVEVLLASYVWNVLLSIFPSSDQVSMEYQDEIKEPESENENSTIYETSTPPASTTTTPSRVSYPIPSTTSESGHEMDFEEIQDIRGYSTTPGFQSQTSLGTGYAVPVTSYTAQKLKAASLPHSMQNNAISRTDRTNNTDIEPPVLLTESEIDALSVQESSEPTESTDPSIDTNEPIDDEL
jgi:hypothetical protein